MRRKKHSEAMLAEKDRYERFKVLLVKDPDVEVVSVVASRVL